MFKTVKGDKGEWDKWRKKNCPAISSRTDSDYRRLAENEQAIRAKAAAETRSTAAKSIRWALRLIAKPRSRSSASPKQKSTMLWVLALLVGLGLFASVDLDDWRGPNARPI